jgi:hypothetical protein
MKKYWPSIALFPQPMVKSQKCHSTRDFFSSKYHQSPTTFAVDIKFHVNDCYYQNEREQMKETSNAELR